MHLNDGKIISEALEFNSNLKYLSLGKKILFNKKKKGKFLIKIFFLKLKIILVMRK